MPPDPQSLASSQKEFPLTYRKRSRSDGSPQDTKRTKAMVEKQAEWPPLFHIVERTHKALNTAYTFCSTGRQLATKFDLLKPLVESHINKPLTIKDIALVVAVEPSSILFDYMDGPILHDEPRDDEHADNVTSPLSGPPSESKTTSHQGRTSRQRGGMRMTVRNREQMTNLIQERNQKFKNSINIFIEHCVAKGIVAEEELHCASLRFIPTPVPIISGKPSINRMLNPCGTVPMVIPNPRQPIADIIGEIQKISWYDGQVVQNGRHASHPREAIFGDLDFLLSQDIVNALFNVKNIRQFYSHQADAINSINSNHNVVIATSTSSGKSLIFQLPVLLALQRDASTRALFIFPTKALAQDQMRSLKEMVGYLRGLGNTRIDTFDGDTPFVNRDAIRDHSNVIFTNPDMLHISILPHEEKWRPFLQNLEIVVLDELHYYNGFFGTHVAFIMRRLRRLCAALGNRRLRFVSCSATAANPKQHFKAIFGVDDVRVIDSDGSPCGAKEFLCWNTPYRSPGDPTSGCSSTKFECARLFCQLILRGVRTIAFCRVRAHCESLFSAIKQEMEALGRGECGDRVASYRGGYTAQERRRIEKDMFDGSLLGIVATSALELGINIGSLDCVLMWGFPYTIANLRQQIGRAGRNPGKDSLSILVGDDSPSDQRYMQNPSRILTEPNGPLYIDLQNMLIREAHIQCAASEMPINPDEDEPYFGLGIDVICRDRLVQDERGFYHSHRRFGPSPSKLVHIRDIEDKHLAVIDVTDRVNVVLEELEVSRAAFSLYEGGIFLHQGNQYLVQEFQPDKGLAKVQRVKVDWTTVQRDYTDVDPIQTEAVRTIAKCQTHVYYGTIRIEQRVFGFFKEDRHGRVLDAVEVNNPPVVRYAKGMWLDVPASALELLARRRLHSGAAIHAAEHAIMALIPHLVSSMPGDVRTECKDAAKEFARRETQRKRPGRLSFYDAKGGAGGSGTTTKAFEFVEILLQQALERISACKCNCNQGCTECVAPDTCRKSQVVTSKAGCQVILTSLLGEPIDENNLPMGPEKDIPTGV